jgi:flagellar FliL protein
MSDEAAATAPKKKGGKMKKMIFFVILPLILIGGGIGAGVFAAGKFGNHGHGPKLDPNRPKLVLKEGETGPVDLPAGKQPNPAIYKSTYVPMDQPFTSNLRDTDGYLQLGVGVSTFYDQKVTDHLKDNDMAVRSAVLEVLAQQSAEVLNTPEGKADLRKELKLAINNVLKQREGFGGIDDVYFTSFIIQ